MKELEAESTAYIVCQSFGIDTSKESFVYLAGWGKGSKSIEKIKQVGDRIQKASSKILDMINNLEALETLEEVA